jgi:hypothetical protein
MLERLDQKLNDTAHVKDWETKIGLLIQPGFPVDRLKVTLTRI